MTDERNPADGGDGLDDIGELSGYSEADQYLATRFKQGGRDVYCIDLSVPQLVATLPKPNPDQTLDANRKINLPHARSFAAYVRENERWIIPPLLLRAPNDAFTFEPRKGIGGTEWGVLTLPRNARQRLKIVDGQHRVLGFHLASEALNEEQDVARGKLHTLERRGEKAEKRQQGKQVTRISTELQRLAAERVSVQIVVVDADEEYKQMFVDIANNAKGITRSVTARFDSRQIVNRCIDPVMEHRLLKDRVDLQRDRILGQNENLMGAKHVADLVRTVQVGISGRITRQREETLDESKLIDDAMAFLDTLIEGSPITWRSRITSSLRPNCGSGACWRPCRCSACWPGSTTICCSPRRPGWCGRHETPTIPMRSACPVRGAAEKSCASSKALPPTCPPPCGMRVSGWRKRGNSRRATVLPVPRRKT